MRSMMTLLLASLVFAAVGCSSASKQESTDDLSALGGDSIVADDSASVDSLELTDETESAPLYQDSSLSEDLLSGMDSGTTDTSVSSDASLGASSSGLGH